MCTGNDREVVETPKMQLTHCHAKFSAKFRESAKAVMVSFQPPES